MEDIVFVKETIYIFIIKSKQCMQTCIVFSIRPINFYVARVSYFFVKKESINHILSNPKMRSYLVICHNVILRNILYYLYNSFILFITILLKIENKSATLALWHGIWNAKF